MSNSCRHTPIGMWASAPSEKMDKKIWHARFRAANRNYCTSGYTHFDQYPHIHDVSNPWNMSKDGKGWFGSPKNYFFWWGGLWEEPNEPILFKACYKVQRRGRLYYKQINKEMRK